MPEFRRRLYRIDAIRFTRLEGIGIDPYPVFEHNPPAWLLEAMENPSNVIGSIDWSDLGLKIRHRYGTQLVHPGDWIILTRKASIYALDDQTFQSLYEPIDDDQSEVS